MSVLGSLLIGLGGVGICFVLFTTGYWQGHKKGLMDGKAIVFRRMKGIIDDARKDAE